MRLQVLDNEEIVYDRVVGPDKRQEAENEQAEAARKVRISYRREAHVLNTDPNTGAKLYDAYWRP